MNAEYSIHTPLKPSELPSLEDIFLSREKPKKQNLVQKAVNKVVKGISSKWEREALAITIGAGSGVAAPIIQEGNLPTLSDLGITIETPKAEAEEESSLPLSFLEIWQKTDAQVAKGQGGTWLWGPKFTLVVENYSEASGRRRLVAYFDKSRMEINHNPEAKFPWLVTNGLLVKEMVTGQMQTGDALFEYKGAANVNVAGDPDSGPTYASFTNLLAPSERISSPQVIDKTITKEGIVGIDEGVLKYNVKIDPSAYTNGHNIAKPFFDVMKSHGEFYGNIFYATGLPIAEPYWAVVNVGGVPKWTLIQLFERRVMTYTPDNPAQWRVEMGNVGQHYYRWRYGESPIQEPVGGPKRPKNAEELLKRTNIIDSTVYNRNGKDYAVESRVTDSVSYKVTMVPELKQELGRLISQDGERHGFTSAELILLGSEDEVPEGLVTSHVWVPRDPNPANDYIIGYFSYHKFNDKVLVYYIPSTDIPFDNEMVMPRLNSSLIEFLLIAAVTGGDTIYPLPGKDPLEGKTEYISLIKQLPLQITSK